MTEEGERVADDVAQLAAEFPAWAFTVQWIDANSGPDGRLLLGWSLRYGQVTAPDAEEMRRKIRGTRR